MIGLSRRGLQAAGRFGILDAPGFVWAGFRRPCKSLLPDQEAGHMIDRELLEILVCPQDHTPLEVADAGLVARLNQAITAGKLKNRGGQLVRKTIQGGLVRQDKTLLYAIIDDIPVLLVDDAIPLDQIGRSGAGPG
jgi:uncharacterized protein YbaR (Trm112 family)